MKEITKGSDTKNSLILKPIYNIDLFIDIPKEKNINSKNIYLNFYNEHTKKKVLQDITNQINKNHYYEQNMHYIQQKQIKNKIKKENEKKIKVQKEKERSLEYREKRKNKLYSSKKFLNNNNNNIILDKSKIIKNGRNIRMKKNNSLPNNFNKIPINKKLNIFNKRKENKIIDKRELKINLSFDNKTRNGKNNNKVIDNNKIQLSKNIIVMTQHKYYKKIKTMIKLSKIYENELSMIKTDKNINIEKEMNLNLLLNSINDEINRYKNKIDILIVE